MDLKFLDFEQPIAELEAKIDELRFVGDDAEIISLRIDMCIHVYWNLPFFSFLPLILRFNLDRDAPLTTGNPPTTHSIFI